MSDLEHPQTPPADAELDLKLQRMALLEEKVRLRKELPHLYGWKWYKWAREFFETRNKDAFLAAANQISKSSTQIRKVIHWATAKDLWPSLWDHDPLQFWYLYPTKDVATAEFYKKWVPQFMPRGSMIEHPVYGWKAEKKDGYIQSVHFKSGVSVYFKTYAQNVQDLQTGTVDYIACFVAGTQLVTPQGLRGVETIAVGDTVLSKDGWAPVSKVMLRESQVLNVSFQSGETLTGTYEHPIWTENRGWVQLGELQAGDTVVQCPLWKNIKKWSYLKGFFTPATPTILTSESINTSDREASICMWRSGRATIRGVFLKGMLSTTETITRWIIGSKISSSLLAKPTQNTTNVRSGKSAGTTNAFAKPAEKNSRPEAPSIPLLDVAPQSAVSWPTLWKVLASFAEKLSSTVRIRKTCTVLGSAAIETKQTVYNIEVESSHTYFANGILTHNCDEELPEELYSELNMRRTAVDGYFSAVFTATIGQEFWREALEEIGTRAERFPQAWKRQVSMYDCLVYEDGTPSHWTRERIERVKNSCKSQAEIDRRVYGKFVVEGGLKYPSFDRKKCVTSEPFGVPEGWFVYVGVDIGGGGSGHPSAIVFIAVRPDYQRARVFRGWRGDGEPTTASDVYQKYLELRGELQPVAKYYDWHNKDFYTITSRLGDLFQPAEKGHEIGEQVLNVLFKNGILTIDEGVPELKKLVLELCSLKADTPKNKARDDFSDGLRYGVTKIPWDWAAISGEKITPKVEAKMSQEERERRGIFDGDDDVDALMAGYGVETELDSIQELYEV